jgi:hypothetical protein
MKAPMRDNKTKPLTFSPIWVVTGDLRNLDFPGSDGACCSLERKGQRSRVSADRPDVDVY